MQKHVNTYTLIQLTTFNNIFSLTVCCNLTQKLSQQHLPISNWRQDKSVLKDRSVYTVAEHCILFFLVSYLSTSAQINKIGYGKFIKNWLILGPFPGREIDQDYLESIGGESSIDPKVGDIVETKQGKSLAWSVYGSQDNTINLLKAIGNYENVTAYAFCYVKSCLLYTSDAADE